MNEVAKSSGVGYWTKRGAFNLSMAGLLIVLLIGFSLPFTLRTVDAGETGVLWRRFGGGTVLDYTLGEGLHFMWPWDKLFIYSVRLKEHRQSFDTISSDGLNMVVEVAVRYRIDPRRVTFLHKHVGPEYLRILIDPAVGSNARELISLYTPEELYKSARSFIQNQITERLNRDNLVEIEEAGGAVNLLMIEDVLVRGITMPESVKVAIERKAEQNQVMLEYEYRLQRETREKERRRIEAEGLRAYQDAMPDGISQSYLILRGIEATTELAKSSNSKLVFFGNDPTNLPFVLNSLIGSDPAGSGDAAAKPKGQHAAKPEPQAPAKQTALKDLLKNLHGKMGGADQERADAKAAADAKAQTAQAPMEPAAASDRPDAQTPKAPLKAADSKAADSKAAADIASPPANPPAKGKMSASAGG